MKKITAPFLFVNPKSYFWGERSLRLAKAADRICEQTGISIIFTCNYADIRLISAHTEHVIVTAQNMESLQPGRGMGGILPEALLEAGAEAVVLNHAENKKTLAELRACIERARELGLQTIVCADSPVEARAAAEFAPDVILAEPTSLIGTGTAADSAYIRECVASIREVSNRPLVMIASGITCGEDCANVIRGGADGAGSTSGITESLSPEDKVKEMADAIVQAYQSRKHS